MRRQSTLLMLVVLVLGILFIRDQRLQRTEEIFLGWLVRNSAIHVKSAPLTIVDLAGKPEDQKERSDFDPTERFLRGAGAKNSPVELALFLQALLEFNPTVVAFEPILDWPENKKDEEQILVDQAIRVPKLLLATELTATPDPDAPVAEISGFPNVRGKRGDLPAFLRISRQPDEDLRLISAPGFVPLSGEATVHVPLLFDYRGEVIPSFALQAAMLWMRVTPAEVKIDIGSSISFPNGTRIPIRSDGTALIKPSAARGARYLILNELLLAAQQKERKLPEAISLDDLHDQIVLGRRARNPFETPDMLPATIATIETNSFVHRVSWIFDYGILLAIAAATWLLCRLRFVDLLLAGIAFSAAYCLIAFTVLTRWNVWIPGFLPLGLIWVVVVFASIFNKPKQRKRTGAAALP